MLEMIRDPPVGQAITSLKPNPMKRSLRNSTAVISINLYFQEHPVEYINHSHARGFDRANNFPGHNSLFITSGAYNGKVVNSGILYFFTTTFSKLDMLALE